MTAHHPFRQGYFAWLLLFLQVVLPLVHAQNQSSVDSYAPEYTECPRNLRVRNASEGLSRSEREWRRSRRDKVTQSLSSYLEVANISDFDVDRFISRLNGTRYPVVGLSVSGGGTQSGMGGLGIWQAFDARYPPAVQAGTGGLSQVLTYITGLSGGGAVTVPSIAANNFSSLENIRQAVNFSVDYTVGPSGNTTEYFTSIFENVSSKAEAGFPVSVTDVFGQFWGNYLPRNWTFRNYSDIALLRDGAFAKGDAPMPIIVFAEVIPGKSPEIGGLMYPGNNATNGYNLTSYEINPYEFGSWRGGRVQSFMPTRWLGTAMSNGTAQNSSQCVRGFDKFTFIQGTTATAFTAWFIDDWYDIPIFAKRSLDARQSSRSGNNSQVTIPPSQQDNPLVQLVNETASNFQQSFNQSLWATYPNPFEDINPAMTNVSELLLVDGSLTGETNPIRPLIIPEREVDFIIVYEASSDAKYSWVNGTNLINTARSASQGKIPFPAIPDVTTMIKRNFTKQPTFFGCNGTTSTPLVLYLPNSPWSGYTNYSYTKSSFTENQLNITFENAFNLATYGNGTRDPDWPACLACAVIRGAVRRMRMRFPSQCTQCFRRHCWDGRLANGTVTEDEQNPRLALNSSLSYQEWNDTVWNQGVSTGPGSNSSRGGGGGNGTGGGGNSTGGGGNGGGGGGNGGGGGGGGGDGGGENGGSVPGPSFSLDGFGFVLFLLALLHIAL